MDGGNYYLVYKDCCQEFAKHNPKEMAQKTGAFYDEEKKEFTLTYLNKEYLISYPEGIITSKETGEENLSAEDKIMVIHYLYQATKTPLSGKWVSYRELKGSGAYYDAFVRYGINPLVQFFGEKKDTFIEVASKLGGISYPFGDISFVFNVFPNIPIAVIIWLGDEEFEASGNILFDYFATEEIHVEDLAALGPRLIREMISIGQQE